jgi:trehalose 6-phosphate synthase
VAYYTTALSAFSLVALYRLAHFCIVSSLHDGMNLVAKEFCAAQVDERGVVIISEFAGAAAELQHGALVVNPNDLAGIAEAIHRACVMPVEEKRSRMKLLRDIVRTYNVQGWAESFLSAAVISDPKVERDGGSSSAEEPGLPLSAAAATTHDQRIA